MTIAMIVLLGLVYPLAMTGAAQLFKDKANGSFVTRNGKVVGSSLIGQSFTDKDGNPILRYFQSRPSAGDGYDALASGGTNHGPSNPNLIGNVPGRQHRRQDQPVRESNRPLLRAGAGDRQGRATRSPNRAGDPVYEKNRDGSYVCDPDTVPERVLAYRELNGLGPNVDGAGRRGHDVGLGPRSRRSRWRTPGSRRRVSPGRGTSRSHRSSRWWPTTPRAGRSGSWARRP